MTLKETIGVIEAAAGRQAGIASIVRNDIFRLNAEKDVQYGVFGWTQGVHEWQGSLFIMRFVFYYVDRLMESGHNEIEVQSTGCEVLGGILRDLEERGIGVEGWNVQTFTQRFSDECAGAFAQGRLTVGATTLCAETERETRTIKII